MNDGKEVEGVNHLIMRCILCYVDHINVLNLIIKKIEGLIKYYKTFGIIVLK